MKQLFLIVATIILLFQPNSNLNAQNWDLKLLEVDTTNFPSITIDFTVFGDKAFLVKDLNVQNIMPYDGEKKINLFNLDLVKRQERLRLCVLLDVSGSMRGEKFEDAKNSFSELLGILTNNDKCALITFGSEITSISGFTDDFGFLRSSLENVQLSMKTRMYDGLLEATKLFSSFEKTRNAIILITDGQDDGSIQEPSSALDKAKRNNVEIYSIGIGDNADLTALAKISEETNSGYHGQINLGELRFVLNNIYELITNSYQLNFTTQDSIVQLASTKRKFGLRIEYENLSKVEEIEYVVPRHEPPKKDYSLYLLVLGFILLFFITITYLIFNSRRRRENLALGLPSGGVNEADQVEVFEEDSTGDTEYEDDENWEDEFRNNVKEQKTVIIGRGQFKTAESLGYLVLRSQKFGMKIFELKQRELVIGRGSETDILLDDEEVSKFHAKVRFVDGKFLVDDMGSSNGTTVNGKETFHTELKDGDIIKILNHELIFKCITN